MRTLRNVPANAGVPKPVVPTESARPNSLYMKLNGFLKGTGKVGNIVVSTISGQTVAREYQPNVSNPNTQAQVEQRSKLKLLSQLSAALAPVIAMPKDGLTSSRNQFIRANMGNVVYSGGAAQVSYENLQMTLGNTGLPNVVVSRTDQAGQTAGKISVQLAEDARAACSRVVYVVYQKSSQNQLIKFATAIEATAGDNGLFAHDFPYATGDIIVWAFGMRDTSAAANAKYMNYSVQTGEDFARLIAARSLAASDYALTETRGNTLFSGDSASVEANTGEHMVYITAGDGGSVSGTGFSNNRKSVAEGAEVVVTATPAVGHNFDGWYLQSGGGQTLVSSSTTYTFTMGQNNIDLIAIFGEDTGPGGFEE